MAEITWTMSDRVPVTWADLTDDYSAEYWESPVAPGIWSWLIHAYGNPHPNRQGVWTGSADSARGAEQQVEAWLADRRRTVGRRA